jgi:integrase
MSDTMRPPRSGGKATINGAEKFKTTRQYIGPDGLTVKKQFVQRNGETKTAVIKRADKWQTQSIGTLPSPKMTIKAGLDLFVKHQERRKKAASTIKDIQLTAGWINAKYGSIDINSLTAPMVDLLTEEWLDQDKDRSALKIIQWGRAAYNWMIKNKWVEASTGNPFADAEPVAWEPDNWEEPMPAADFDKALAKVGGSNPDVMRALYLLLRWTGCRPDAARNLHRTEIYHDPEGRLMMRHRSKTKNSDRPQLIPEPAAKAILALPTTSVFVFSLKDGQRISQGSICKLWKRACEAAGVPHRVPYELRDMRLTELADILNPKQLQYVAGHSSVKTTLKHYVKVEQEALKKKLGG